MRTALKFIIVALAVAPVWAEESKVQPVTTTDTSDAFTVPTDLVMTQWGLTAQEWQRYLIVKEGPIGQLNDKMNPLLALAMAAKTDQEAMEYIEKFVDIRKELTDRTLHIARLYPKVFFEKYDIAPIDQSKLGLDEATIRSTDKFILVTTADCPNCIRAAKNAIIKTRVFPSNELQLYLQDTTSNDKLVSWAKEVVPPEDLESGRVWINTSNTYLKGILDENNPIRLLVKRNDKLFNVPTLQAFTQ